MTDSSNHKTNISSLPHEDCTGCRVCGDICPKSCISFAKDDEGFYYPAVDEKACISCSLCRKSCPAINPTFNPQADEAIAAYASDRKSRQDGSSGGLFGLLARAVIAKGGKVWGAAFTEGLKLKHCSATDTEMLRPLMRSKYIQSDTSGCYKEILDNLRNGIPTLFSGTPCQCNALLNVVKSGAENLVTVEVVCHGVPSQDLFDRSIAWWEKKKRCKVEAFTFRAKPVGAKHPHAYSIEYACGDKRHIKSGLHYQFPYYFGFQKYLTLRPSCYRCLWANPERCADITLADFWGIEKYDDSLNAKDGVSAVIINTAKGQQLFDSIVADARVFRKRFPLSFLAENNGCLTSPTVCKSERKIFFDNLRQLPFEQVVNRHLVSKRRWIFDLYYSMPGFLRKLTRRIMDKRMRYE